MTDYKSKVKRTEHWETFYATTKYKGYMITIYSPAQDYENEHEIKGKVSWNVRYKNGMSIADGLSTSEKNGLKRAKEYITSMSKKK